MNSSALAAGLHSLRGRLAAQQGSEESDEQLLHAFTSRRDDNAFAALVRRHGPMVLHVCRRVLGHEQDAEDAFQATFLVLARNAAALRKKSSLASFLHGVAHRTALKAKQTAARRRKHEGRATAGSPANPADELSWREVRTLLDEEIGRLPEKYRIVFVLFYLEELSREETARRLGLKDDTVAKRLARARKRLGQQLARRGVELTAVLAAAASLTPPVSALPAGLTATTIKGAVAAATGERLTGIVSASVAQLVHSATTALAVNKAKLAVVLLLVVSLLAAVAGGSLVLLYGRTSGPLAATPADLPAVAATGKPQPRTRAPESRESVEVSGRVVDPDGKPVSGAKVVLHQRRPNGESPDFFPAPAIGTTDGDGQFRFSGNVHLNAPTREYLPIFTLTAHVPGFGPAAVESHSPPDGLQERTLRLVKDDVPIRGRILNLEGRPIPGVTVRPVAVVATAAGDLGRLIEGIETNKNLADLPKDKYPNIVFPAAAAGLTQTTRTDSDGRFTLSGFGRERIVVLRLDGPSIETSLLNAMTRIGPTVHASRRGAGARVMGAPMPPKRLHEPPATYVYTHGNPFDFAVGPALVVEGTVRDQDNNKPIAGVIVRHGLGHDFGYQFGWAQEELATTTDADGNYRLAGLSRPTPLASQLIQFLPPPDQPYFLAQFPSPGPELGKPAKLDVVLKRGVWVKGRVTDKATAQPVQAVVEYFAFTDNPLLRGIKGFGGSQVVSSKKDGSFALAALPGRGIVAVKTDEMRWGTYLHGQGAEAISGPRDERIDSFVTRPYMCTSWRFDTLVGIEPDAKTESVACAVQLDPGKTVQGTILEPDGKPLAGASIRGPFISLVSLNDLPTAEFVLPAINPHKPEAYFFEHQKKNLAAAVILKGDEAAGFTVQLKPTATITGRLVNEKGEPVRNYYIQGRLAAGQLNMTRDYNGFFWGLTGDDGRFKIEGLLAGVKLGAHYGNRYANLTLQPGEVRNLGDITVKNALSSP